MMPTVAYVADKLNLPGNHFNTIMQYCDKNNFRDVCDKINVPCPKHIAVSNEKWNAEEFDCPLPWIVKPADSQSSIGIKKINKISELPSALKIALSNSPTHTAIVEEFFKGKEIVCEGFINEGKYYNLSFGDRKYFNLENIMIPSQTLFPSTMNDDLKKRIEAYEQSLSDYTKPSFAIVHSEYLVDEELEEIRIVESALRGGGVYISSDLIPMATGIDINDVLLDKALGINLNIEDIFVKRKDYAAGYVCFYLSEGIIKSISGISELDTLDYVEKSFLDDLSVGSKTSTPRYKGARKGPILVGGKNRQELESNIEDVQSILKIDVLDINNNIVGINWK